MASDLDTMQRCAGKYAQWSYLRIFKMAMMVLMLVDVIEDVSARGPVKF